MPKNKKEKISIMAEKSMIEKHAPDKILNLIGENKMTYADVAASYDFYFRLMKFIDLNFETYLKYDLPLLSDMHKVGEYSDYLKNLDLLGIEYRSFFYNNK